MILCATLVLLGVLPLALWGIGVLVTKVVRMESVGDRILTVTSGLAAFIFIGGLLNLGGIAHAPAIWACVIVGLLIAFYERRKWPTLKHWRRLWPTGTIIGIGLLFVVVTQLSPEVYNYHDDFQKYFAHPARMLETGTVLGSPVSAMGSETLGGQAFLHGVLLSILPFQFLNGMDGVLGLALCLFTAADLGRKSGSPLIASLCVSSVLLIHPQYVNISGLYLPAALMMVSVAFGAKERPSGVMLGMLYAAMIALKSTAALFVILHAFLVICCAGVGDLRRGVRTAVVLIVAMLSFLAPWLLVHARSYFGLWDTRIPDVGSYRVWLNIFSTDGLFYGASMANYTGLVFALATASIVVAVRRSDPSESDFYWLGMGGIVVGSYFIVLYALGPLYGNWAAVRYFTPIAIGVTAPMMAGFASPRPRARFRRITALTLVILALVYFAPSWYRRSSVAIEAGTGLPFPAAQEANYRQYSHYVFSDRAKYLVRSAQQSVPAGEPLLAWINFPFYLDYHRNAISDVDTAGLATPWARLPRVDYIIWQRKGYASLSERFYEKSRHEPGLRERLIATRTLDAMQALREATGRGTVIWEEGGITVYKVTDFGGAF